MSAGAATPSTGGQAEAERLLGIAQKLLRNRDLTGAREFAVLSQETDPLLEGSDQILAICDVLLAGDKGLVSATSDHDWYGILQVERRSSDADLIRRSYRRLALLLHPDKNKYPLADSAFRLVADAWAVLSDQSKKSIYDSELSRYAKVDLTPRPPPNPSQSGQFPVRRSPRSAEGVKTTQTLNSAFGSGSSSAKRGGGGGSRLSNFWTACPYCYVLYEYPRSYEDYCLRCQSCQRAFHAAAVPSLPPIVPGKEAYYCCWGFFPLGFSLSDSGKGAAPSTTAFPNWMPPMFSGGKDSNVGGGAPASAPENQRVRMENSANVNVPTLNAFARVAREKPQPKPVPISTAAGFTVAPKKKRGRPRKNPL